MESPLTMNFTCFAEREDILHSRSPAAHCSRRQSSCFRTNDKKKKKKKVFAFRSAGRFFARKLTSVRKVASHILPRLINCGAELFPCRPTTTNRFRLILLPNRRPSGDCFLAIFSHRNAEGGKTNSLFLIFANYGGKTGSRNTSRLASSPASQELCDVTQTFHDQTTAEFSNSSTEKLERSKEQNVRNRIHLLW
ncbi:hypothetical protein CEXT_706571 [Caerostris extrusa]|uniref:Uncharacterized protein n=1 Tax=Caerostris extrusa TaxID=172846 RepID=A0AAV4XP45_CAEEX|nr:hypothetical protein CEXT_706571 [Caerostris extrusa]